MATRPADVSLLPAGQQLAESPGLLTAQVDGVLAICAIFTVLCSVAVGLRVYVRTAITKAFGRDDWAMCVTLLIFWTYMIMLIYIASHFRRHVVEYAAGDIPTSDAIPYMTAVGACFYTLVMMSYKFSIGFFFLNIFSTNRTYRILIWSSIVFSTVFGLFTIIWTGIYPCQVYRLFFVGLDICRSTSQRSDWVIFSALFTIFTAVTDVCYAALSFVALRHVRIPRHAKRVANLLCTLGCVASVASAVRGVLVVITIPGISMLGNSLHAVLWGVIEPGLGITAASLVTLRPLVRKLNESSRKSFSRSSASPSFRYSDRVHGRNSFHVAVEGGSGPGDSPGKHSHNGILVEVQLDQWRRGSDDEQSQRAMMMVDEGVPDVAPLPEKLWFGTRSRAQRE